MSAVEALLRLQEASFAGADRALGAPGRGNGAMGAAELESFLDARTYCVLATATGRPQARPVALTLCRNAFWFASVAGGRLRTSSAGRGARS